MSLLKNKSYINRSHAHSNCYFTGICQKTKKEQQKDVTIVRTFGSLCPEQHPIVKRSLI